VALFQQETIMGLDMYAFTTTTALTETVDFPEPEKVELLHQWRKHPNLHGWMEELYIRNGGADRRFNCSPVVLDAADLNILEVTIINNRLPETSGFFFGESDGSERDDDLEFIAKARAAIAEGKTVFYTSSW
jgi:hypothetical protein